MQMPASNPILRFALLVVVIACSISLQATAQERREPDGGKLPSYAKVLTPSGDRGPESRVLGAQNELPNIMITGYWPPTNEMVRQFSTNPEQNPGGWVGEDWEGRGYNIYSFFPEFPGGLGKGEGDFEVDYQDTSGDWWLITPQMRPRALITFSRAGNDFDWELEGGNRTYALNDWTPDYLVPLYPTPELPIAGEPPGTERFSSLPMQEIVNAVAAQVPTLYAYIEPIDNSRFLSNFIGYHGNWYRKLHSDPSDPDWARAAGHIHVGYQMNLADAVLATEVTLRTLITFLDSLGDMNCDGTVDGLDVHPFVLSLTDPRAYRDAYPDCNINRADVNNDAVIDLSDIDAFVRLLTIG